jgi:hypothetical protein
MLSRVLGPYSLEYVRMFPLVLHPKRRRIMDAMVALSLILAIACS